MVLITPKLDIKIDKKYRVKEEETFRGKRRYVRKEISGSRKSKSKSKRSLRHAEFLRSEEDRAPTEVDRELDSIKRERSRVW